LLLRLSKEASEKIESFGVKKSSSPPDAEENQCNSRYPQRLDSVRCGQNAQVSPFFKDTSKDIFSPHVASNRNKCSIMYVKRE
jgi:hypothetical protein